jgi:phage FluMu gp28-like protein
VRLVDRTVRLPGGGEVAIRSADEPDSLRGFALDFVVLDECAFMKEAAWTEVIRAALGDRLGGAVFFSTRAGTGFGDYGRGQRTKRTGTHGDLHQAIIHIFLRMRSKRPGHYYQNRFSSKNIWRNF